MATAVTPLNPMLAPAPQQEPLELLIYWRAIFKRKWWILASAAALAALTAFALSFVTPVYRATVTLLIEQSKAKLVSIEEVYSGVSANREHYQTQAEILKSPALATAVIKKLGLERHAEFDPRQRKPVFWSAWVPESLKPPTTNWTAETIGPEVLADFVRRITIEPVRLSQLVKLGFDAADPQLAARVANELAEAYLESDIAVRAQITQKAGDWLADRLSGLKHNLEDSERALQEFREREGLLNTRGLPQGGATRNVEVLTTTLLDTRQRRVEAENNYNQIKAAKGNIRALPVLLRSDYVDRLQSAEGEADKRLAIVMQRYGPEHPRAIEARKVLAERRENTTRGMQSVIASFAKDYEIAVQNERAVERNLLRAKGVIQGINRKEFQLEALQRDVDTNRQIYERFLNRYRETRAAGDAQSSVVARIVDPAIPPSSPYKPDSQRIALVGFLLGLILAITVALLRERADNTVKTSEEVEEKLNVPTLAVLPLLKNDSGAAVARHYLENPSSVFSEAIRTARTSLLLSAIDSPNKILLITSSVPSEGKSAFSTNLALAHAQTKKTLLIEGDLRRPSVVRALGLDESKPGLTSLFAGTATFSECVQRVPGSTLYVLPAGTSAANPLELLSSERFRQMLIGIAGACEMVLIDSPPLHLVSDAAVLSTLAHGVLFVVKAESTPYPLARRCLRTLSDAGAAVVGVALNQLDFSKDRKYYGGYTRYASEYGYKQKEQPVA